MDNVMRKFNKSTWFIIPVLFFTIISFILCVRLKGFPNSCTVNLPEGFADIGTVIPDAIISIKYSTDDNFTGEVLNGYENNCGWGLEEMVMALKKVHEEMKKHGYRLMIYDSYRPMRSEQHMIRWAKSRGKHGLLGVYIPGSVNYNSRYGHTSGNAVDLTISSPGGRPVDMGSIFDDFSSASHTARASGTARKNRLLLKKIMERHGFKNYENEWWHYQYLGRGDRALDVPVK